MRTHLWISIATFWIFMTQLLRWNNEKEKFPDLMVSVIVWSHSKHAIILNGHVIRFLQYGTRKGSCLFSRFQFLIVTTHRLPDYMYYYQISKLSRSLSGIGIYAYVIIRMTCGIIFFAYLQFFACTKVTLVMYACMKVVCDKNGESHMYWNLNVSSMTIISNDAIASR